jgi:hypothetical protein
MERDETAISIVVGPWAEPDIIRVETRASVYELLVVRAGTGEVLVRGGSRFPQWRPVHFIGSTRDGESLKARTIEIGCRMHFIDGDRLVITSPVQSLSRPRLGPFRGNASFENARTVCRDAPPSADGDGAVATAEPY